MNGIVQTEGDAGLENGGGEQRGAGAGHQPGNGMVHTEEGSSEYDARVWSEQSYLRCQGIYIH